MGSPAGRSGYTMPTCPSGAALVMKVKLLRKECGETGGDMEGSSINGSVCYCSQFFFQILIIIYNI